MAEFQCTPFRLMSLPGEQRNAIYRLLFDSLVEPIADDVPLWEKQWPTPNFSPYAALIRTCRAIHGEASSIFEQEYLPKIVWHFSDVHSLHQFAQRHQPSKLKAMDLRFKLRYWSDCFAHGNPQLLRSTFEFIQAQPTSVAFEALRDSPDFRAWLLDAWRTAQRKDHTVVWRDLHSFHCRHRDGTASYDLDFAVLCPSRPLVLKIATREVGGIMEKARSLEGNLGDLDWSSYGCEEAETAAKAFRLWEQIGFLRSSELILGLADHDAWSHSV